MRQYIKLVVRTLCVLHHQIVYKQTIFNIFGGGFFYWMLLCYNKAILDSIEFLLYEVAHELYKYPWHCCRK